MRVLLDANVLIWLLRDKPRLTTKALVILEDDNNELFVNRASLWEISAKTSAGRLDLLGNSIRSVLDELQALGVAVLPITDDLILRTETLPWHHADPFDRIVVAQALAEGFTILTADRHIPLYDAPTIWK